MFRYLISPTQDGPTLTAITITADTITTYRAENKSVWDHIKQYFIGSYGITGDSEVAYAKERKLRFRHATSRNHSKLHSTEEDEPLIQHVHIPHGKKISSKQLKKYLNHKNDFFLLHGGSKTAAFPEELITDIVTCYKQHLSFNDSATRTYSNYPAYTLTYQGMPSIAQHSVCLYDGLTACDVNKPYPKVLSTPGEEEEMLAAGIVVTPAVIALGALAIYSLFKFATGVKSVENTQNNQAQFRKKAK